MKGGEIGEGEIGERAMEEGCLKGLFFVKV
jgi:hypothetical protein